MKRFLFTIFYLGKNVLKIDGLPPNGTNEVFQYGEVNTGPINTAELKQVIAQMGFFFWKSTFYQHALDIERNKEEATCIRIKQKKLKKN